MRTRTIRGRPAIAVAWPFIALLAVPQLLHADGIDVGSFTKSTSGAPVSQVVAHGLGETPDLVILFTAGETDSTPSGDSYLGFGASDGGTEYAIAAAMDNGVGTTNASRRIATKAISIVAWGETTVAEADLTAWDADDFTLNWTTNDATATIIHYIAIGGSGISADVRNWTMPTATGDHSVTGVGFQPDVVIHAMMGIHTGAPSNSSTSAEFGLGVMDATGDQWCVAIDTWDGDPATNCSRIQRSDRCILSVTPDAALGVSASFGSMDSDGFTVDFADIFNEAQMISISISGVNAEAGTFDKITSGSSQEVNGVLFSPDFLLLASWQRTASGSPQVNARIGIGATDGTDEGTCGVQDEDNSDTTDCDRFDRTDKVFAVLDSDSQSPSALADLTSFDADGFTLNWSTNSATATEICYLALVPFSAIDVRIGDLAAATLFPGVEVRWRSEVELDNVGFHVHREGPGGVRERISPLIPGSAFLAPPGAALSSAQGYGWFDAVGGPGDRYWIEDHDLDGTSRLHGPVTASPAAAGGVPAPAQVPVASAATSAASTIACTSPSPRTADATSPIDPSISAWLGARSALVIGVDREGWVRVTHDDWVAAGLPSPVAARFLQLYYRGGEHAIEIEGDADGLFGPGDAVLFYGLGVDTPATATACYWLTVGDRSGKRIRLGTPGPGSGFPPDRFLHTVVDAEAAYYFAALRNGADDNFFGEMVSATPLTRSICIPHFAAGSPEPVTLEVSFQGIGAGEHQVSVAVDGALLGDCTFAGTEACVTEFTLSPSPTASLLEVSMTASGSDDFSFLDGIAVTYPRTFVPGDELLRGTAPGSAPIVLSPALPGTRVFDVTDPAEVAEPFALSSPLPGGSSVTITALLDGGGTRTWASVPPGTSIAPVSLRANAPSAWRAHREGASFVVIAPEAWTGSLEALARLRRSEGLRTAVVAAEDVFDEWNGGMVDPGAMKRFLEDATRDWLERPRYLLLVGDATYDPRERLPGTLPCRLPARLIDSARLETASDHWFGDLGNDGTAEIAVGRLPFATLQEVDRYILRKAIPFAAPALAGTGRRRALVVNDDDDVFPFSEGAARARTLFPGYAIRSADRNRTSIAMARSTIETTLAAGVDLVVYSGHGGTGSWGAEDLLTTAQVAGIGSSSAFPVVISTSCLNGYFHHRLSATLAESWVAAERGAIAVFASATLTNPYAQQELGLAIIEELLAAPAVRLGDALLAAQGAADPDTVRTTVLIGDPTAIFRR